MILRFWKKCQYQFISLLLICHLINQIKADNIIYDDPLPVPTLIRKDGYRTETHEVITEDGYILNLHRIPNPGRPPVLVNHGILGSSAVFVLTGLGKSLAYVLYNAGYDVWLGNYRGNFYSRKHVSLNITDFEFWQFGIHEMGIYDLPAEIDYVLDKTHRLKLSCVGFSLATMYHWILLSERPEYNDKINQIHALAPPSYWENKRGKNSPLRIASLLVLKALNTLSIGQFVPITIVNMIFSQICKSSHVKNLCSFTYLTIFARGAYTSLDLVPVLINTYPAGLSVKTIEHPIQLIGSDGKFSKFDYGSESKNLKIYNRTSPPEYDLSKVTTPVYMQYAMNDIIALPQNVKKLCSRLGNCKQRRLVPDPRVGHDDFTWGYNSVSLIYNNIINILQSTLN